MLIVHKPLNSFSGVNWSSNPSINLPVGPTYNEITLVTSLTAAQIRQVTVVLNGDAIIQVSGERLVKMEKYKGHYVEEGRFIIPFTNPNAKNQMGSLFGGLVTLPTDNITLEVEIAAGSGALSLSAEAAMAPTQTQRNWIPRIRTYTMQAGSIGWNDFTTFQANAKNHIRRAYFEGDINRLKIEVDNIILFDSLLTSQNFQLTRCKRFPQEGEFTFDSTMYGYEQADILNTGHNSEFAFRVETNAAKAIPIVVESIEKVATSTAAKAS